MTVYGYARVSTTGQSSALQKAMFKAAGVARIFSEKVSGVAAKLPELERVLDELTRTPLCRDAEAFFHGPDRVDPFGRPTGDQDRPSQAGATPQATNPTWPAGP